MAKADINDLKVGDTITYNKLVTQQDINLFAEVSGDMNPVHIDQEYAQDTVFKGIVAHGMLTAAYISKVLGTILPGEGSIYLSQSLKFVSPVRPGNAIAITVEILEVDKVKRLVKLRTIAEVINGMLVVEGEALLKILP